MAKQVCQTEHPEISEMMYLWVSKAMDDGIFITGEVIYQKWNQFADLAGVPEEQWLVGLVQGKEWFEGNEAAWSSIITCGCCQGREKADSGHNQGK
jgi:hypothetical protein